MRYLTDYNCVPALADFTAVDAERLAEIRAEIAASPMEYEVREIDLRVCDRAISLANAGNPVSVARDADGWFFAA